MLKVLIVDDEPLVRTGIWYSICWQDYGMEPVAEADGVDGAIDVLQQRSIDIVFTDIVMPGRNGLDLLRWIQTNSPMTTSVVLSYHNDFSYIQKALRYGAADYILKTELNHDDVKLTLQHVAQKAVNNSKNLEELGTSPWTQLFRCGLAIISPFGSQVTAQKSDMLRVKHHIQVSRSSVLLLYGSAPDESVLLEMETRHKEKNILVVFKDTSSTPISSLLLAVKLFSERDLFYLYLPDISRYDCDMDLALNHDKTLDGPEYAVLEEEFSSMQWIYDEDLFSRMLERIIDARPLPSVIYNLFYSVQGQWARYFADGSIPDMLPISNIRFWYQWVNWLNNFKTFISNESHLSSYSPEILASIQQLLIWLSDNFSNNIKLKDAAKMVNLSESHLSRTFKNIVGLPFNIYVRGLRISHAKKLLTQSALKINDISDRCGFTDRFYFSKVFKKETGMAPSEYRNTNSII